jgi:hypothetical protein
MTARQLETAFIRLQTYTARAQLSVEAGNISHALADVAEIHEIARRLWTALAKVNQEEK